jgi:DNA polymerase III sliding clamp (beta) subunit (PCNA family)
MLVDRESFLNALECARPGLEKRWVDDHTGSFLFQGERVVTYNDEISVSAPVPLDIKGAVPANELYKLLRLIADKEVDVTINDNRVVIKNNKHLIAKILIEPEILIPIDQLPKPDDTGWIAIDEDFIWKMRLALFSVSKNLSKPVLACLHWYNNTLEATDNLRVTRCTTNIPLPEGVKILFPSWSASALLRRNPTAFKLVDGWLYFQVDHGAIFSCRTFEGKFPVVNSVLAIECNNAIKFPAHFIKSLERATVLAEQDSLGEHRVEISVDNNVLSLKAAKDIGEFEDCFVARCDKNHAFWAEPASLIEILKHQTRANFSNRDDDKGLFLKFEGDGFVHLIALARR